jgi:hypothetical protein
MKVVVKNVGKKAARLSTLTGEIVEFKAGDEKEVDLHDAVILDLEKTLRDRWHITKVVDEAKHKDNPAARVVLARLRHEKATGPAVHQAQSRAKE